MLPSTLAVIGILLPRFLSWSLTRYMLNSMLAFEAWQPLHWPQRKEKEMGKASWGFVALSLSLVLLAPDANASIRKCNAGPVTVPGFLMMVDGEIIGDFPAPEVRPGDPGPAFNLEEFAPTLETADVLQVEFTCSEHTDPATNSRTLRVTISVLTRSGLPRLMQSYLEALVERQEGYRAAAGGYATHLNALSFYESRILLPIDLRATSTGWSATAFIAESPVRCYVAVGSIEPPRDGLRRGVPECFEN